MVLIRDYGLKAEQTCLQIHTNSWRGSGLGKTGVRRLFEFLIEQFVYFYIGLPRKLRPMICCPPSFLFCSLARMYSPFRSDIHNMSLICVRVRARALLFSLSFSFALNHSLPPFVSLSEFLSLFLVSLSFAVFSSLSFSLFLLVSLYLYRVCASVCVCVCVFVCTYL